LYEDLKEANLQEIVNQIIVYLGIAKLSLVAGVVLGNCLAYNLTLL
jgi:hypothetical protein